MKTLAKFQKLTISPGKPAQVVLKIDQDALLNNDGLSELATLEEDELVVVTIDSQQSTIPFEDITVKRARL